MSEGGMINLAELPVPQLQAVKTQLEEEINSLTQSFAQLRQAHAKFQEAQSVLPLQEGSDVLVPITPSLYVPGKLSGNLIIDVGTGYYCSKTCKEAQDYFGRKKAFVGKNLGVLEATINQKQNQKRVLLDVLATKMKAEAQ